MIINIPDEWFESIIGRSLTEAERRKMIDDPTFSEDFFDEVIQGTSRNIDTVMSLLNDWGFFGEQSEAN